jgi:transposase
LADKREDNGESRVDDHYVATLLAVVDGSPRKHGYRRPTWTQELLILVLHKHTEIRLSRSTMSRLLKRLNIRLGAPKPTVGCPWKKARRTRRINDILRRLAHLPRGHVAVYVDEVDIHLNPKIGRDWMRRGTQKYVLTPGKNQKRYLAGSLDAHTGQLVCVEADRKDSDLFIRLLWHLANHVYPQAKCIHIILDNYKIHSSERTQLALGALGTRIQLHFLPPYCPDHNRIERTWRDLHDNVTRNHQCRTMDDLMHDVRHYLKKRDRELRKTYAKKQAA